MDSCISYAVIDSQYEFEIDVTIPCITFFLKKTFLFVCITICMNARVLH